MNAEALVNVVAYGPWAEENVRLERTPSSRHAASDVEHAIDEAWKSGLVQTPRLFDGPMCRLERLEPDGDQLGILVSDTSYKIFYGTHLSRPVRDRFGPEVMSNAIGLSPALLTSDGYLAFGRRNHSVAYYPGRTHPFAGALEPGENPFTGVRRELGEELGLSAADVIEMKMLGVIEDRSLAQPEFIFLVTITKTLADLRRQLDAAEHDSVREVRATQDGLCRAASAPEEFTPVAMGTMWLYDRYAKEKR